MDRNTEELTQRSTYESVSKYGYADALLCTALDVGEGLLRSGAEITRVEDTITRICRHYGAVHVEVFSITSLIIASVRLEDGSYSNQNRHVPTTSNNLHRLQIYNSISREICVGNLSIEEAQKKLHDAKRSMPYGNWGVYLGAVLASGGFAVFFGGSWFDFIPTAIIGIIITYFDFHHPKYINSLAMSVINSFVAGVLAILCIRFGFGDNVDKIMIGTIMLLIPGLSIGNSVRDMLSGETVSGFLRFGQSIILAAIIALGYGTAIIFMEVIMP